MQLHYPDGKTGHSLTAGLAILLFVGAFYTVGLFTAPTNATPCPEGYQNIGGAMAAGTNECAKLTVTITYQQQSFVDLSMLAQGYTASCYAFCSGITYTLDPTIIITSSGHDFEQCQVFGAAGVISPCTKTESAAYVGLTSTGPAPLSGDTSGTGPCKTTSPANEIITGGLMDALGTVTAGAYTTSTSSVVTTIAHTFTAAETDSAVSAACLQTESSTGANIIIYAEGTFGPDTLGTGNTIAVSWSITRS